MFFFFIFPISLFYFNCFLQARLEISVTFREALRYMVVNFSHKLAFTIKHVQLVNVCKENICNLDGTKGKK